MHCQRGVMLAVTVRSGFLAAIAVFSAAAGCGGDGARTPIEGTYTRAAFHLVILCPDRAPKVVDLLYPVNDPVHTFRVSATDESGDQLAMTWDGELLARGHRNGDAVALDFVRRDPFVPEVETAWRFRGRVREDFRFHERTIVGQIEYGYYDDAGVSCRIAPRSIAWFTTRPGDLTAAARAAIRPRRDAQAHGGWNRFVWFLDVGPFAMHRRGDPGQRGQNLRLFSFASTGGGVVTAGNDAAFADNGFDGGPWPAVAGAGSLSFAQFEPEWELEPAQDVLWDDGKPQGYSPGVRRVLAGFVTGRYRIRDTDYPSGWEGETGLLSMQTPGMAYWLDIDRGPEPDSAARARARRDPPTIVPLPASAPRGAIVVEEGMLLR